MARLQQRLVGWPVAVAVLAALAAWAPAATARDADMCSTLNTGSGSANMSIFQTVGLCYDFCIGDYAYAVVNYQSCWCTNWEPAETTEVDMDECDRSCPGYPDEKCGGAKNRFGYIALGMAPSGTSSPPGASTKVVPPATTTVQQTVTIAPTSDAGSEPAASSPSAAPSSAVAGKPDPETVCRDYCDMTKKTMASG
jgi:cell wall integrity and stress response component